jgi:carbon storage regulator CsrA
MLVLSRRPDETILFPGINTSVRVVSCKGGRVRLGIDAPPGVAVLRGELSAPVAAAGDADRTPQNRPSDEGKFSVLARQLCDRLKVTGVGLGTAQLLLDTGQTEEAKETLVRIGDDFQLLRRGLEGELEETSPEKPSAPCKAKALLVEDDRNQRELLAGFLRMAGLEVDTAGDGSDALDHLRRRPRPDVVLLDMGLPRCDGMTAVRRIRRDPSYAGLRIFAVTGSSPNEFDLPRGPTGVDRWFQKPLDLVSLLHDLRQELDASARCV